MSYLIPMMGPQKKKVKYNLIKYLVTDDLFNDVLRKVELAGKK
jgi:hypothetical protein